MNAKMLTPEQEKMFEENQGLVINSINMYISNPGKSGLNDYDDLKQIGYIALCHAIQTFKPERNNAFSTYATTVIRNRLYNATRDGRDFGLDTASCIDDFVVENSTALMYNNINKAEESYAEKEQEQILTKIAESYGGIAEKGVMCIILMMNGYTCKDCAEKYGTTQANITSWISRARSKLKKEPEVLRLLEK